MEGVAIVSRLCYINVWRLHTEAVQLEAICLKESNYHKAYGDW